ncbi:MAG: restriction endonuclease [Desulfobacterales bacterium]
MSVFHDDIKDDDDSDKQKIKSVIKESADILYEQECILNSYDNIEFYKFREIYSTIQNVKSDFHKMLTDEDVVKYFQFNDIDNLKDKIEQLEDIVRFIDKFNIADFKTAAILIRQINELLPALPEDFETLRKQIKYYPLSKLLHHIKSFQNMKVPDFQEIDQNFKHIENNMLNLLKDGHTDDLFSFDHKRKLQKIFSEMRKLNISFKLFAEKKYSAFQKIQIIFHIRKIINQLSEFIEKDINDDSKSKWKGKRKLTKLLMVLIDLFNIFKSSTPFQFPNTHEMASALDRTIDDIFYLMENKEIWEYTDFKSLQKLIQLESYLASADSVQSIQNSADVSNIRQRELLREKLACMNPYDFEVLISTILNHMGYENIQVTKKSNDLGIDMVADLRNHMTKFTVAIQVKRQKANVGRPVLDQLRGALGYYQAEQGIIIATGDFVKGCKEASELPGQPKIRLINGEQLLDYFFEYGIGIKTETLKLQSIDEDFFDNFNKNLSDK